MPSPETTYVPYLVALGIGLLIGAERERNKGTGPHRAPAGLRTFAVTSLLGAIAMTVGGAALLGICTGGVVLLVAIAYMRGEGDDPGLTTEIALVATLLLGGLAVRDAALAAGAATALVVLLAARAPMHRFVRDVLTQEEMQSILILAAATLVVWPVLPDRYLGPWQALNPRTIWSVVILVMAIGAAGYVAVRVIGARYGLAISGLASGFVSSSATIAAMGDRATADPRLLQPAVAGALLSNVATVAQAAVLLGAISPALLAHMWPALAAGGVTAAAAGGLAIWGAGNVEAPRSEATGPAFSLTSALTFAAMLAAILMASAGLRAWLGSRGTTAAAALAGFADAHSAMVSVASAVGAGQMEVPEAALPVLLAFTTNSMTKIILALGRGTGAYRVRVVAGVLAMTAALWGGHLLRG